MLGAEVVHFEKEPSSQQALRIRRWDDQGKITGLATAGLPEYRPLLEALAEHGGDG
jgi:predicted HD phosphohydrolase